jgi:uncharacterized protein YbjQ (UPF0145 family)
MVIFIFQHSNEKNLTKMMRTSHFLKSLKLSDFPIVTTECLPGFKILRVCGVATGSTVRTRDFTKDMASAFKTIIGGELTHYTSLLQESRQEALDRMRENASKMDANAVVCARLVTSNIAPTASEVMAYGTAVVVERVA